MNEQTTETDPLTERDWLIQILGRMDGLNVSRPIQRQAIEQVYGRVMDAIIEAGWESDESAALRDRLADLLTRTANALKGDPEPLMSHDWSDLPDVAASLIREAYRLGYEDRSKERDFDPGHVFEQSDETSDS